MFYDKVKKDLRTNRYRWLVTGVAGFIGSNILEELLLLNQQVIGLDNFLTGYQHNLDQVKDSVAKEQWERFEFVEGNICDLQICRECCQGVDFVLHQAALGSVPRSIKDPITTNEVNISGFLNVLLASSEAGIKRFVYAASSSTYGDEKKLPKVEDVIGRPLSPYAVTKLANELYADVFARVYGIDVVGLRYFNIFGPRQNPNGAYAAVIPKWINNFKRNATVWINGDGENSRDFCYVKNAVQANILSAMTHNDDALNQVYNIAAGDRINLTDLARVIKDKLKNRGCDCQRTQVCYREFRQGDVAHSLADVSKAKKYLSYEVLYEIGEGLDETIDWYCR